MPLLLLYDEEAVLDEEGLCETAEDAECIDASEEGMASALDELRELELLKRRPPLSEWRPLDGLRGPAPNCRPLPEASGSFAYPPAEVEGPDAFVGIAVDAERFPPVIETDRDEEAMANGGTLRELDSPRGRLCCCSSVRGESMSPGGISTRCVA